MKTPAIQKLDLPKLLRKADTFESRGKLLVSENNLLYLDIDDAYIHELFPLLIQDKIRKPDYFGKGGVGAHISIIYPEEKNIVLKKHLNKEFSFTFSEIVVAEILTKKYYVLLVESPELLKIRKENHLPEKLNFKGYEIGFHITVGVK